MSEKRLENQSLHVNQLEDQSHWFEQTISETLEEWKYYDFYRDDNLWDTFRLGYEDITEEEFEIVSNDKLEEFRDSLRRREVWVQKDISVARALVNTLLEKEFSEWSEENQSNISVIEPAVASVSQSAVISINQSLVVSVSQSAVASINQSLVVSVIQSVSVSVSQSSIASVIQSISISVNQSSYVDQSQNQSQNQSKNHSSQSSLANSVNQSSQQVSLSTEKTVSTHRQHAVSILIKQAIPKQAISHSAEQASSQASSQASDQAISEKATSFLIQQAISKKAVSFINQNVTLIFSQNVTPNFIQKAASSIIQNAAFKQAISSLIQQTTSEKAALFINQNVTLILSQHAALILIKHTTSEKTVLTLIKNAVSVNQYLYVSASHFLTVSVIVKSVDIQSIIQHLIVCLLIIINTLSAKEIDWVETKKMSDVSWDELDTLSFD